MKTASTDFSDRLHRRLRDHAPARQALTKRFGINFEMAERFQLGLAGPYPKKTAASPEPYHQDALVAPVRDERGRFIKRYVYAVLPGVTADNRLPDDRAPLWTTGPALTYYSRTPSDAAAVFVCSDVVELWALAALIARTSLEGQLVLIASTRGTNGPWPQEWMEESFWSRWKAVYIGVVIKELRDAKGRVELDGRARELARLAKREVFRVPPQDPGGWSASCVNKLAADSFRKLLTNAAKLDPASVKAIELEQYSAAHTVDLTCAYHGGYLYETVRVVETSDQGLKRYAHIVIRSDRTSHRAKQLPCSKDTPKDDRIVVLDPDGAQLFRQPRASPYSTWRWPSVQAFLSGAESEPLVTLLGRIGKHLRASVWLPRSEDYAVLTCVVAATFCQQMFEAVPLIFVNGPKGTAKSTLGKAVADLCCNSSGAAQVTAATLTRLVDWTNGFVFIDDLESMVGRRRDGNPNLSELVQALKVSYKQSTAVRYWTNADGGMRVERLKFFGIKMINNTSTIDEILESRVLSIPTRAKPKGISLPSEGRLDPEQRAQLRDQLHTCMFSHVAEIARAYAQIFPSPTTREDEISAPLRVIAHLSGDTALQTDLERALGAGRQAFASTPQELMEEAVQHILVKSIKDQQTLRTTLTVQEVLMRLRLLADPKFGKSNTTEISEVESPEWVGRQFRQVYAATEAKVQRTTMYEVGIRFWALHPEVLERAVAASGVERCRLTEEADPRVFCGTCATCDYSGSCPIERRKPASSGGTLRDPNQLGPRPNVRTSFH